MKIAVCFSGQARAVEYTHHNIQTNLLDKLGEVDTFFNICDDSDAHKIEKYFTPTDLQIEKDKYVDPENYIFYPTIRGTKAQYLRMLNSRQRVNDLREQYAQDNKIKYDCVIASRLDVKYFNAVPDITNLDFEMIYVPDFHSFKCVQGNGCNDRFAMGNDANMTTYFNLPNSLHHYCSGGHRIHGESTLHLHLAHHGIKTQTLPIRFSRVRSNGEEIDNRLKAPRHAWKAIDR